MSNYPLPRAYKRTGYRLFYLLVVCVLANDAYAERPANRCLLDALALADESVTVGERIAAEAEILERSFVLTAHRPNYVLPYTYNSHPNEDAFRLVNPDQPIDSAEAQFQVSFKFPLAQRLFNQSNDLFFGFTSGAWWQVYNDDLSSPFRETDYEPELFLRHYGGPQLGPIKIAAWDLGLAHQSNGQSKPLSRSWNRVNANLAIETGTGTTYSRQWFGRGQKKAPLSSPGRFPYGSSCCLYLIHFDGYGESLLDYEHRNKRIGIGIGLNDYLETRNSSR